MPKVTIDLTEGQYQRLAIAAAFVGSDVSVEALIVANALARLDDWSLPRDEVRRLMRSDIRVYCRERATAPVDLLTDALQVGLPSQ